MLSFAGSLLRQQIPEDLAALQERYGYKTLKQLMVATDLFDFHEESTTKGGIRASALSAEAWLNGHDGGARNLPGRKALKHPFSQHDIKFNQVLLEHIPAGGAPGAERLTQA